MFAFKNTRGRGLSAAVACALLLSAAPAVAAIETPEAKAEAADAAMVARSDMDEVFGPKMLKPGQYVWRKGSFDGDPRVIVSLSDQQAYLYRGGDLVAVAAISTGKDDKPTPKGIFTILDKKVMHRSKKYDDAPMPFMQRFDEYGTALHAGHNPGYAASHGCIRLPVEFAKRLFGVTEVGATVMIGA
ncbi:L,D-transpeptidase family protein [Sphingomonas sp. RB56-2]|uniref:L,D-transpeptidase family protein n=1 Tax=Sphingomonas brevis TaxID=2908206 RepID=A0ABT0S6H8_9SPHN|nr:L,D-transpeptidase family protein [Sphingomonas brevis]MCL6739731.1 L,D-transpeptidase family protein [Sphingomonas brevis]